jgi:hypothetical protein
MMLSWGLLIPLGVVVARYLKVLPGQRWPHQLDNPTWWHAHRASQYTGVAISLAGAALAWNATGGAGSAHAWVGWIVICMGMAQVLSGTLRGSKGGPTGAILRGDHYDMSPRRVFFERFHKTIGYCALTLACVALYLGLAAADAPRWMWLTLTTWWLAVGIVCARWQRQGRAFDTYQAIWGPGLEHPGNRVCTTGIGVHRHTSVTFDSTFPNTFW